MLDKQNSLQNATITEYKCINILMIIITGNQKVNILICSSIFITLALKKNDKKLNAFLFDKIETRLLDSNSNSIVILLFKMVQKQNQLNFKFN